MKITLHCYIINYYLTQWTDNRMPDKRGTDNRGSTVFHIVPCILQARFITILFYLKIKKSKQTLICIYI